MRPKWLLTGADGTLMFRACLEGLSLRNVDRVAFVIRNDHASDFKARDVIDRQIAVMPLGVPHVTIEVEPTRSQPETVARALAVLAHDGPFFIKDVDNRYRMEPMPGNRIAIADLNSVGRTHPGNKSYVAVDDLGQVTTIVEKSVISNTFCCGGYGFAEATDFRAAYERVSSLPSLYVSHVIYDMLMGGAPFATQPVEAFEDWGTIAEWRSQQRQCAALFVDLDGVLVRSSSQFFEPLWGESAPLEANIEYLNRLTATGRVQVFVTTSRTEEYEKITRRQLDQAGLKYHGIVMGVLHARRFVVNDFAHSNPFPSSISINLTRDSETLEAMLTSFLDVE